MSETYTTEEVVMNDESQSSAQSQTAAGGQQKKRNRNRNRNKRGGQGQGADQEESKEPTRPQTAQPKRGGGGGGQGQKHYQQKQYQQKQKPVGDYEMKAGPQYQINHQKPSGAGQSAQAQAQAQSQGPSQQQQNQTPYHNNRNYGVTVRPVDQVVKPATEEGFTGPTSNWFSDDEYRRQMLNDFGERDKHDYYFGSYSSFHIHEEMLKDTVRTRTYQRAIMDNPEDFRDKIVMDIGAGTGILSIFAAKAGAKHVYAIEFAEIAHFAKEIIRQNGLESKITVLKGKMEELTLPVPKVDIIISEWMGYFLLYESMLDCVLWARDKYLAPGGKMLPDRAQIYIAAIEDAQYKHQKMTFWDDVYGVNMSCLTPTVMKEPLVDTVEANMIMSSSCKVLDLDLVTCRKEDVEFTAQYSLRMNYTDRVHGLVAWFDTPFGRLTRPILLSTSPYKKYTHWKQTVFYMEKDLDVREGDTIYGSIACRKSLSNFRELDVKISYHHDAGPKPVTFTNLYKIK